METMTQTIVEDRGRRKVLVEAYVYSGLSIYLETYWKSFFFSFVIYVESLATNLRSQTILEVSQEVK